MKNTHIFIILFFFSTYLGFAQQKIIDSLEQQLINPTNGKSKLFNLIDIAYHYQNVNPKKGILYLNEAIPIAKKDKDSFRLATAYVNLGSNNFSLGNDSLAFSFYDKAATIYKAIDSSTSASKLLYNTASQHSNRRNYKKAQELFTDALEIFSTEKDTILMAHALKGLATQQTFLGNYDASLKNFLKAKMFIEQKNQNESLIYGDLLQGIGALYQRLKKYDEAIKQFREASKLFKKLDYHNFVAAQYINIGVIYNNKGEYEKAFFEHKKAYTIFKKNNNKGSIGNAMGNMSVSLIGLKKYDNAILYIDNSIKINLQLKNYPLLARNYSNKAIALLGKNDYLNAIKNLDSSALYANKTNDKGAIHSAKLALSAVNFKQGYYKKAHTALEEARILKDSLLSDEKKEELAVLRAQYDFDKEKAVLEAEFQKDQAIQEAKISQQVLIRNASLGGGAFLILALAVGFLLWRKKREADYNAQLSSSKLQSLRAQINPHFIFNSLNSINDYILKNEKQTASNYLGEFSMMVRTILENTEEEEISLEEEIKFLKSYVALEQKRLKYNFSFQISIDKNLPIDTISLPPSLLQPFIENSIWHRLSSKEDGILSLSFTKSYNNLICTIEDNGIGVSKDDDKKGISRKSFGLQNVKNRLNLLKKVKSTNVNVVINNREEGGVSVKVTLPLLFQF